MLDAPAPPPAVIEVLRDHGGTLGERAAVAAWAKRNGIQVRIKGLCGSSCYFLLTLKGQVCVYPQAWFAYHAAPGQSHDVIRYERGHDLIARGLAVGCR